MGTNYDFLAFISYKREDEKWAKWLQRKIEGYRLPANLSKKLSLPAKMPKVFRDTTDIEPGTLSGTLEKSLDNSRYLIVVCSVKSAGSYWVGEEIQYFIKTGRQDQIILFIIDGIPYSGDPETDCIHPVIKQNLPEMLGVNINEEGREWRYIKHRKAFLRVLSSLLGITFDMLWNRYRRRMISKAVTSFTFAILFLAGTGYAFMANQPFDMDLGVQLNPPANVTLPFPASGAVATLYLDNQQLKDTLSSPSGHWEFPNIPARYKWKGIRITVDAIGFHAADTTLQLGKDMNVGLQRDASWYGIIKGVVRNIVNDTTLDGATVEINGILTETANQGGFTISVPLSKQEEVYTARVRYQGKEWRFENIYPMQHNDLLINTIYIP